MTTGFEPVTSAVTGQCTGQLCYVTMFLRSGNWTRTSRDGLTVRSFAINGYRNTVDDTPPELAGITRRIHYYLLCADDTTDLRSVREVVRATNG